MTGKPDVLIPTLIAATARRNLQLRERDAISCKGNRIPSHRKKARRMAPIMIIMCSHQRLATELLERIVKYIQSTMDQELFHVKVQAQHRGMSYPPTSKSGLYSQFDILIFTPGRLMEFLHKQWLDLSELQYLVMKPAEALIPDIRKELHDAMNSKGSVKFSHPAFNMNRLLGYREASRYKFTFICIAGEMSTEKLRLLEEKTSKLHKDLKLVHVRPHGEHDNVSNHIVNTVSDVADQS